MNYIEIEATHLVNAIPHSKFSVTKGMFCRLSTNAAFGCETMCSYCYIRFLTRWKGMKPNDIFRTVFIRRNAPQLLRKELRGKSKEWLWVGSTADPHQRFEEKYGLMRPCLEILGEYRFPYEIITKAGALVTRDVDLQAATSDIGLLSMRLFSSFDEGKRQSIEIKATSMRERIDALASLNRAGVRTSTMLNVLDKSLQCSQFRITPVGLALIVDRWVHVQFRRQEFGGNFRPFFRQFVPFFKGDSLRTGTHGLR